MKVRGGVQRDECDCVILCVCVLHETNVCSQKNNRRTVTKTPMKTMTGMMMMMMIMTAAQKREELLWTTVFALQVSSVEQLQLGPIISSSDLDCLYRLPIPDMHELILKHKESEDSQI